jgi:hypothetical protein
LDRATAQNLKALSRNFFGCFPSVTQAFLASLARGCFNKGLTRMEVCMRYFTMQIGAVVGLATVWMVGCGSHHPPTGHEPGPFCGGFAGIACPGAGTCHDDPNDDCDPANGGADCGGVCACEELAVCAEGYSFDASPEVCACVASEPPIDPCAAVRCPAGTHCSAPADVAECVPDGADEPCGSSLCTGGMVCCNASCGICTPPDGACIQIACE